MRRFALRRATRGPGSGVAAKSRLRRYVASGDCIATASRALARRRVRAARRALGRRAGARLRLRRFFARALAPRGLLLEALAQRRHQVDDLRAALHALLRRLGHLLGLARLHLALDLRLEVLAVGVVVLLGLPLLGHVGDEPLGEVELLLAHRLLARVG